MAAVRQVDIAFDHGPETRLRATVAQMRVHRARRGPDTYSLGLRGWSDSARQLEPDEPTPYGMELATAQRSVRVSRADYERVHVGMDVDVVQRRGFLGIRWVERVEPARGR